MSERVSTQVPESAAGDIPAVGVDLVYLPSFREQWNTPGTTMATFFTTYEKRQARKRAAISGDVIQHLAARWAAKEAFIKAWGAIISPAPPLIAPELVVWSDIEVRCDNFGRPTLHLHGDIERLAGTGMTSSVSLSHDGDYAIAMVSLAQPDPPHHGV